MASRIVDTQGNIQQSLNTVNNEVLIDARPNTTVLAATNAEVNANCSIEDWFSFDVRGTFVATMIPQYSVDGTNYNSLPVWSKTAEAYIVGITTVGTYGAEVPTGTKTFRLLMTAYTSGSATVAMAGNTGLMILTTKNVPATLHVTNTGASGAAVTLTLPASTGLFHYITNLKIEKFAVALLTAGATPTIVTTTNLIGSRAYSIDVPAMAQGTMIRLNEVFANQIRSTAAGTATTIVCPATTSTIWRISVDYFLGA